MIEDAAQALGATYRGAPAGTLGDYGVFSCNSDQVLTTSGGGMLLVREHEQHPAPGITPALVSPQMTSANSPRLASLTHPMGGSRWLTCLTIVPADAGIDRDAVLDQLANAKVEAQPIWKPMHLQPAHAGWQAVGGEVAQQLYSRGLCLPSGSTLTDDEVDEVAGIVATALG